MNVYKLGTKVRFRSGGIEGYITGVCIRVGITYAVSYFNSGNSAETWHYDFEFEVVSEKMKAGFHKDKSESEQESTVTLLLN